MTKQRRSSVAATSRLYQKFGIIVTSVATSDILTWHQMWCSQINFWCFDDNSDVNWVVVFFPHFLSFWDENKLDSWFLSFFHQSLTFISDITTALTQGWKLSWRGYTGHRRGPTSQNSEKKLRKIVNLWMSWMSVLDKKTKTPRKTQKPTT